MGQKLDSGDTLPSVTLKLVGGETVNLPDDLETPYGVVLFYRGHW
jgi:peroxiredoxin